MVLPEIFAAVVAVPLAIGHVVTAPFTTPSTTPVKYEQNLGGGLTSPTHADWGNIVNQGS